MDDRTTPTSNQPLAEEVATLRRELTAVQARLNRATRRPARQRRLSRLLPLGIAALLVALVPLATLAGPVFSDLDQAAAVHQPNIQLIGDAGITTGSEDPNDPTKRLYKPKDNVTREEMATFLARTAGLGANPPVVNAAQLGGTSATAYAQKAQFKGTEVLDVAGPLPKSVGFTSNGGILVIFVSGSASRPSAGLMGIELDITGTASANNATVLQVFTNEASSHKAFPSEVEILTNLPAGNYTFTLKEQTLGGVATVTNANDRFTISVIEIPRP